jgi:hypothetical protein
LSPIEYIMDKNTRNWLFIIASGGLLLAGVIFFFVALFDCEETTTPLVGAIGCLLLSNLFALVRQIQNKAD